MRLIKTICTLVALSAMLASCLNSSDEEATYYGNAAITSFSLGTLNRYLHTSSSAGEDSVYTTTVTGSSYYFMIDQVAHRIYNRDSLPVGTDVSRVVCTLSTLNNGVAVVKDVDSDTLRYYSSTDSIDFTQPRQFRVYSNDGTGYSEYTISVNVHQEYGEEFVWNQLEPNAGLAAMTGLRAVSLGGVHYVFGATGGNTVVMTTTDGQQWSSLTPDVSTPFGAEAWQNVVKQGDTLYLLNGSSLLSSTNGTNWQQVTDNAALRRLVGASSSQLYALSADNHMLVSNDGGLSWAEDQLDETEALLPADHVAAVCYPMNLAAETDYVLLAGSRSLADYPQEAAAVVWRKIVDDGAYAPEGHWTYMERSDGGRLALPRLSHLAMTIYDDGVLAIGGAGLGGSEVAAYTQIYQSRDNGINWKNNPRYQLPEGFDSSAVSVAITTDSQNYLWLFAAGTGQVWRGRLNQLGWEQ